MTDIQALLRRAEFDAEKLSALVRLIVFAALAVVIFSAERESGHEASVRTSVGVYGVGTLAGLVLAWRRIFHPVIPYLFVTFDVVLVAVQLLILARLMGMNMALVFMVPAAALIFVILIHASMRYRPWLIAYAATLFVFVVTLGRFLFAPSKVIPVSQMHAMHSESMGGFVNFQALPVVLIALSAIILFVIVRRTRDLLTASIRSADQAARLSRFFSPNLAQRLAGRAASDLLSGRRQSAAVLFVDIRGFTDLGETMSPEELGAFLTEYRNRLTPPIFARDGTVDKFIGDAIMAVFGAPVQANDDARRALACALDIIGVVEEWSRERVASGLSPVAVGVGAHYGEVFAGALGGDQVLEYTVIGDTVNVAERLERLSRRVDSTLVVSAALLDAARVSRAEAKWRQLSGQRLEGRRKPIEAFYLVADVPSAEPAATPPRL